MAIVLCLLDAFRYNYLSQENTPFLWECAQKGEHYERVIPSLGYCERSEILSGLKPDESGYFTAIGYDPETSPFRKIKWLLKLKCLSGVLKKWISKANNGMRTYEIPLSLLPYWNLTEDKIDHRLKEAFPSNTILSLLENAGKNYFYASFTSFNLPNGTDNDRMRMALHAAGDLQYELYLIYISSPDIWGHEYGPDSLELKRALYKMDRDLEAFSKEFIRKRPESKFVFLGDHGMVPISLCIDVESELLPLAKRLNIKIKKDFIYFLDSTLMRVWFLSEKARAIFEKPLKESVLLIENGLFIDESLAKRFHIPWNDKRYGDLIWLANAGGLVFPNFFLRKNPYKGCHGYDPYVSDSQGTCIIHGSSISKRKCGSIQLTHMFQILSELLGLQLEHENA